jgi:hypothetical protein
VTLTDPGLRQWVVRLGSGFRSPPGAVVPAGLRPLPRTASAKGTAASALPGRPAIPPRTIEFRNSGCRERECRGTSAALLGHSRCTPENPARWASAGFFSCGAQAASRAAKEDHGWRRQYHRQQHPRCPRRQPRSGPFQCILGRDRLPMKRGMTVQWWLVPVEGHKRDPRRHRGGLALHFGCWDLAEASWGAAATGRIA